MDGAPPQLLGGIREKGAALTTIRQNSTYWFKCLP